MYSFYGTVTSAYASLVFVFGNIDAVDDRLYHVGSLTCAEVI